MSLKQWRQVHTNQPKEVNGPFLAAFIYSFFFTSLNKSDNEVLEIVHVSGSAELWPMLEQWLISLLLIS